MLPWGRERSIEVRFRLPGMRARSELYGFQRCSGERRRVTCEEEGEGKKNGICGGPRDLPYLALDWR